MVKINRNNLVTGTLVLVTNAILLIVAIKQGNPLWVAGIGGICAGIGIVMLGDER